MVTVVCYSSGNATQCGTHLHEARPLKITQAQDLHFTTLPHTSMKPSTEPVTSMVPSGEKRATSGWLCAANLGTAAACSCGSS